jgi:hypothetical protein
MYRTRAKFSYDVHIFSSALGGRCRHSMILLQDCSGDIIMPWAKMKLHGIRF